MSVDPIEPIRFRDASVDEVDLRAGELIRKLGDPVLPSAAAMAAIEAGLHARAQTHGGRRRRLLTWAVATAAMLFGVTLGAAASGWIGARPRIRPAEPSPAAPAHVPPPVRHRPRPQEIAAPPAEEAPVVLPDPEVAPPAHVRRLAASERSPKKELQAADPPPEDPMSPESRALGAALRKLRLEKDPRGALAVLDDGRSLLSAGTLAAEAGLVRVEALIALGDQGAALAFLDGLAIEASPRRRALLVLRGELRAAADRCGDAVGDLAAADSGGRDDTIAERALYARASCASRLGDDAVARRALEEHRARFPEGAHAAQAESALRALQQR
jgi:hypothetical protein